MADRLGLPALLSTGETHHDLALVETDASPARRGGDRLHHLALKIGDGLDALASAKEELESAGNLALFVLGERHGSRPYAKDPRSFAEIEYDAARARAESRSSHFYLRTTLRGQRTSWIRLTLSGRRPSGHESSRSATCDISERPPTCLPR